MLFSAKPIMQSANFFTLHVYQDVLSYIVKIAGGCISD